MDLHVNAPAFLDATPQPRPAAPAGAESSTAGGSPPAASALKSRRAFKACAHCRSRKAKCDLGDLDNPFPPPCSRCRREGVACEFLPSRRGGRIAYDKQKRSKEDQSSESQEPERRSSKRDHSEDDKLEESVPVSSAMGFIQPLIPDTINEHTLSFQALAPPVFPPFPSSERCRAALRRFPPTQPIPPPISSCDIFRHVRPTKDVNSASPNSDSNPLGSHSDGHPAQNDGSGSTLIQHRDKRRKKSSTLPRDPDSLAAVSLSNPADALNLLVLAADGDAATAGEGKRKEDRNLLQGGITQVDESGAGKAMDYEGSGGASTSQAATTRDVAAVDKIPTLSDFPLVEKGIVTPQKLYELVNTFISRCHFLFPMIPNARLPRTEATLAKYASEELHLVTVFVLIASRHDKNTGIHEKTWVYFQTLINDIVLGKCVSVGAVEALLLLSDYLPRQPDAVAGSINAEENRLSWMVVGLAVRLGYMLGLDQKAFAPITLSPSSPGVEAVEDEALNRERLAWTYCYLFDRQISIRTGKAFWSRGPALCFSGGSAAKNFPLFRFIPRVQDDFASLIQAYIDLTQIMSSCHDILYPTRERTIALGQSGEYFAHFAHFTRTFEAFKHTWEGKRWETYPLTECGWITYHYLRLYTYGFAMQAHIQRENDSTSDDGEGGLFSKGLMASPDARYILEAIDAAADLLRLVVDRLHPGGALPFLPWRFFMFISYAGVFLLKAVYVGVVAPLDRITIVRLLKRLIVCLAQASTDAQHPGVRYARLLQGLLRAFNRGRASALATQVSTPARQSSPPPLPNFDFLLPSKGGASHVGEASSHFPPTFPSLASGGDDTLNDFTSATAFTPSPSNTLPPYTMPPFAQSRPFRELATSLEESAAEDLFNFDVDFDFGPEGVPQAHSDAFSFLLEDSAMDFWASFSTQGDDWLT